MGKVFQYSMFELLRSRWILFYLSFYLLLSFALLFLNNDPSKVVISLLNVIIILSPLISIMFTCMYYYNSREFIELLLAQPIPRSSIFLGQYLGVAVSLSACTVLGIGIPVIILGSNLLSHLGIFFLLLIVSTFLCFIFCALAFNITLRNENRIKGFSYTLLIWLFLAVIYDGILLIALFMFKDYPLERPALIFSLINPIDLSRILLMLKLETSALMGYTGAVFNKFFGTNQGMILTFTALLGWILIPVWSFIRFAKTKNF